MGLFASGSCVLFGGALLVGGLGFELHLRQQGDQSNARVNEVADDVVMGEAGFLLWVGSLVDRALSRLSRR
jgi:hypothetical protein